MQKLPNIALYVILAALLATMFSYHHWTRAHTRDRGVIKWDVISYYAYLPATFIYKDVSLEFVDEPGFNNDNKFWFFELENGNRLIQTSMGLSILYSPFFFAAHALAPLVGEEADGFDSIYQFFLVLSSLFYVMMGLIILRKILRMFYSPAVTAMALLLVGLGTNLFYYTAHEGAMSHGYNFALITLFLYVIIRWYGNPTWKRSVWVGLVYGMIVLVRPSNIITGALFLLWDVKSMGDLRDRAVFLFRRAGLLAIIALFFLLPWIPQFLYWKTITGSFLFNSYGPSGSNFYFGAPHIAEVLFSYRKGWFVYTPVMLAAAAGLFFLGRYAKQAVSGIALVMGVQIYLLASWWSWWNGGSFGHRSFVDIYGIMALPLAALVATLWKQRQEVRIIGGLLLLFLIYLNQFQTWQYSKGLIHYNGMTREAYWHNFLRFRPSGEYWLMLAIPDHELARLGIYVDYDTGADHTSLKEMDREAAIGKISREIEADDKLRRQIRRHAERTGTGYGEVLRQVAERVYSQRISG